MNKLQMVFDLIHDRSDSGEIIEATKAITGIYVTSADQDYWAEYDNEQTIVVTWSNPYCESVHPLTYYRADGKALVCMVFHNGRNNAPTVTVIRPAGRRAVLRAEDMPPCCIEHLPQSH